MLPEVDPNINPLIWTALMVLFVVVNDFPTVSPSWLPSSLEQRQTMNVNAIGASERAGLVLRKCSRVEPFNSGRGQPVSKERLSTRSG